MTELKKLEIIQSLDKLNINELHEIRNIIPSFLKQTIVNRKYDKDRSVHTCLVMTPSR